MRTDLIIPVGSIVFVLFILNAVFLGVIFFMRRNMATVNQWPSTMGTVMASRLEQRHSSDSGWVDYPVIQYSYQVGGQSYQGMKLAPGLKSAAQGQEKSLRAIRLARR